MRLLHHLKADLPLHAGCRIGVAVSGGSDSVALLRLLLELRERVGFVLAAVHFDHKLRGRESQADARFAAALAKEYGLEFYTASARTALHAGSKKLSIEAAARELRYGFFHKLVHAGKFDHVATAHTLNDQAETVLLRLFRGSGIRGLGGILPVTREGVIRPLLGFRHDELQAYLRSLRQPWREDSSNADPRFTRNRLRHELMPQLARDFNPSIEAALARTAAIARLENDYLDHIAAALLEGVFRQKGSQKNVLDARKLSTADPALQRRVLLAIAARLAASFEMEQVEALMRLIRKHGNYCELANGWAARREKTMIRFERIRP